MKNPRRSPLSHRRGILPEEGVLVKSSIKKGPAGLGGLLASLLGLGLLGPGTALAQDATTSVEGVQADDPSAERTESTESTAEPDRSPTPDACATRPGYHCLPPLQVVGRRPGGFLFLPRSSRAGEYEPRELRRNFTREVARTVRRAPF